MLSKHFVSEKKRIAHMLTAVAMVWIMTVSAIIPAAAATPRATTMKLEKTEGTVTLKTQNGSARKITKGMRLYNGNTLGTGKRSYAYVSLDSSKAVKLDQSSLATLRQSGGRLELLVKSGKLFFNVSTPLTEKENMNVRTSTMVTGIRGTCGVVEYVNPVKSKLYLLEGKVTLGSGEHATTIYGGQTATVVLQLKKETDGTEQPGGEDKPGEQDQTNKKMEQKVTVETLTEEAVPLFAIEEIVSDPILQEKIEKTTKLKVKKLEEVLKESKEEVETKKEEEEKKPEETTSSGDRYVPDTPAPTPTSTTLTGAVSAAAINAALAAYNKVTVAASATDAGGAIVNTTVTLEENVTIPAGKALIVESAVTSNNSSTITVGDGTLIDKKGTLVDTTGKTTQLVSTGDTALCTCAVSSNISSSSSSVCAKEFNAQVAGYFNELAQKPATVTVNFQKPAVVKSDITLQPASESNPIELKMGSNTLEIQSGTLTLTSNVSITSSSSEATVLLSGGNLVLQGTSTATGGVVIQNEGSGTAIKRTDAGTGTVKWNDSGLSVAGKNGVDTAIAGATASSEIVALPAWVTVTTGYLPVWKNSKIILESVASEFTSGTVSASDLNKALSVHTTVTVGPNANASLGASDTVTVPNGRTLRIQSQVISTGDSSNPSYSNAFYLDQGTITLKDRASLNVSGYVLGTGTINAGETGGAEVLVNAGGLLCASELNLTKGSSIINNGTIDTGTITTDGTETINNYALIKTKAYSNQAEITETGTYTETGIYTETGTYSGGPGSVLVNNSDLSGLLSGVSLLAYANTSAADTTGLQYFYSGELNTQMANRINTIKSNSGVDALKTASQVWWHFENNALVPSDTDITLTDFYADMGTKELQVAGKLTLSGAASVTGTGKATVRLNGGILLLGIAGVDLNYAEIKNTNTGTGDADTAGYAIKCSSGKIFWNNKSFHVIASGGFNKTLSGSELEVDGQSGYVTVPAYVTLVDGKIDWNPKGNELRYVP